MASDSLADMMALRSAKRQGVKVVVPAVQCSGTRIALADGPVLQGLGSHTGSNETIDTLERQWKCCPVKPPICADKCARAQTRGAPRQSSRCEKKIKMRVVITVRLVFFKKSGST